MLFKIQRNKEVLRVKTLEHDGKKTKKYMADEK
jgi:hypothetical protein